MDWRIFFTAFTTILVAELADKTEMAVLSLTAKTKSPWPIFWGAMLAFAVATLIAVLLGGVVTKFVPINIIRFVSAGIFILIGVLTLLGKL
jgi:putative Ca2+/H+ antiporter (TMEM165/GDT1 family)